MKLKQCNVVDDEFPPFGVVLCGGGAAGRWQAGVLTALAQLGVLEKSKVITGTSVGGLNAGLFSLFGYTSLKEDKSEEEISIPEPYMTAVDVWEGITKNSDIYQGKLDFWGKIGAGIGFFTGAESILDNSNLHKLIDKVFGNMLFSDISKNNFTTQLIISALNLNTQREEFFSSFDNRSKNIKIADALKATSAIPGIFKSVPITISGKINWYIDGGAGANNPFISLAKYNSIFSKEQIKKAIVIFCFPDEPYNPDDEINKKDTKEFRTYRDVLFNTVPAILNAQEQLAEMIIVDKVMSEGWDIMALWPDKTPCDSLDFTKTNLLQEGYNYATEGKGWDYKNNCLVNILDFLRR